ncbi:hypothetical protein [Rhizosaccharibacter radicis]|uniref:Lipoprotein transmembrane n=1 Tax=Rhizosaccharibacter radicis TaxID=2782605 RepID=A0ABT1W1M4_9PROT|nr:hypothetical protein [Acetobacteraceae bacterium KSS12]
MDTYSSTAPAARPARHRGPSRRLRPVAALALALAGLSLGGCVVYEPSPYYHHPYGYRPYYGW